CDAHRPLELPEPREQLEVGERFGRTIDVRGAVEPGRDRLDLVEDRGPGRVDRVALVTERRGGFDRARELDHALAAFREPLGLDDLDVPGIAEAPDGLR